MKPDIEEVEPDVYSVLWNGRSYEVRINGTSAIVEGHAFETEAEDPRAWKRTPGSTAHGGKSEVTAPMPGKVVRVLAAAGDDVEAGQGIVVVEAMKMQNELRAPRAARVSAVNVKAGDSVNAGAVLAVLE